MNVAHMWDRVCTYKGFIVSAARYPLIHREYLAQLFVQKDWNVAHGMATTDFQTQLKEFSYHVYLGRLRHTQDAKQSCELSIQNFPSETLLNW